MDTVYLIVKNLDGLMDNFIIPLVNERNGHIKTFTPVKVGDTWGRLKQSFEESAKEKGRGSEIEQHKDGFYHWVLPFTPHPLMKQPAEPNDAFVLDKESYINYGWDIIEEEI